MEMILVKIKDGQVVRTYPVRGSVNETLRRAVEFLAKDTEGYEMALNSDDGRQQVRFVANEGSVEAKLPAMYYLAVRKQASRASKLEETIRRMMPRQGENE